MKWNENDKSVLRLNMLKGLGTKYSIDKEMALCTTGDNNRVCYLLEIRYSNAYVSLRRANWTIFFQIASMFS